VRRIMSQEKSSEKHGHGRRLKLGRRLVPSNPGPAPLAPELTALEQELNQLGLNVAATHYHQAVDNYTDGNFEAIRQPPCFTQQPTYPASGSRLRLGAVIRS